MLTYTKQREEIEHALKAHINGSPALPFTLVAYSGTGKTSLIERALKESERLFVRVIPNPILDYSTVVEESIKLAQNMYSEKQIENCIFWFDEVQHWTGLNFDAIQIEEKVLNLFGIEIELGNIIFSGYALKANESTKARLSFYSLPRPKRTDIFRILSKSEYYSDLKRLKKCVDFSSASFHEVVNAYNLESPKTRNPLGLSNHAFTLLQQISEGGKMIELIQRNGWTRAFYLTIESELVKESLIERDKVKDTIRILTKLGRKKSKERACKF